MIVKKKFRDDFEIQFVHMSKSLALPVRLPAIKIQFCLKAVRIAHVALPKFVVMRSVICWERTGATLKAQRKISQSQTWLFHADGVAIWKEKKCGCLCCSKLCFLLTLCNISHGKLLIKIIEVLHCLFSSWDHWKTKLLHNKIHY